MSASRRVRCPQCGGESVWDAENPFRPFCSQRCKLIDLGAWASESYRVPVPGEEGVAADDAGERPVQPGEDRH